MTTPARMRPVSHLQNGLTGAARAQSMYTLVHHTYRWVQNQRNYTVSVRANDPLYQDVHDWLLDIMPGSVQKTVVALTVGSLREHSIYSPDDDNSAEVSKARLGLKYDDKRERKVVIDGHKLKVATVKPDTISDNGRSMRTEPETITFTATTKAGQDAVIGHLRRLLAERKQNKRAPALWMLNSWGSWSRRDDLPPRELDSVILRAGQLERIVDDLDSFLQAETQYNRLGIPWHRGYLFHGPPGTGKTSLAKALANHFGLDLWYAPLGDLSKDSSLLSLLSQVHARSLLVLEDVDIYAASHEEEATKGEVSLSGLLNALDGIGTPHGLITVLTTNDRTALDPALLRPGRIDRHEEILPPDAEQAERVYRYLHGTPAPAGYDPQTASVAALVEEFKRQMA